MLQQVPVTPGMAGASNTLAGPKAVSKQCLESHHTHQMDWLSIPKGFLKTNIQH